MYEGPNLLIDSTGFNIYVSSIIIWVSEFCSYIPIYYLIDRIRRNPVGYICLAICAACSLIIVLLETPNDGSLTVEAVVELVFVFIFKFTISFVYSFV